MKFFVDECLSPELARRLCGEEYDAIHPLFVGRLRQRDHNVLQQCYKEDRIIVTGNAKDFRGLVTGVELHPGLIILPPIDKEGTWRLLCLVLKHIAKRGNPDPANYMVNRVIEADEAGKIGDYSLP